MYIGAWESYYNQANDTVSRHLCNGEYITKYTERTKSQVERDKALRKGETVPALLLTAEQASYTGNRKTERKSCRNSGKEGSEYQSAGAGSERTGKEIPGRENGI